MMWSIVFVFVFGRLYLYLSNQHDVVDCICLFKTNLGFDHLAVAGVPIRIGDPIEFFIRIDAKKSGRQTCIDNLQFSSILNSNTDHLVATCINHHAHFVVRLLPFHISRQTHNRKI